MRFSRTVLSAISAILLASDSYAADSIIAPLPAAQDRITPPAAPDNSILTTKPPANEPAASGEALPWRTVNPVAAPAAIIPPLNAAPMKSPFGRGEPLAPIIPSGPHSTIAVPVVDVQALDAPQAAPATQTEPDADPVKQDPAEPTELTSPIFGDSNNTSPPRKIILRLLNKVTAQSSILTFKPNETVKVGTIEITAITCQTSAPQSQTDYAALVDVVERLATSKTVKPLFRGWMYASSPSITALEHPVYDVTMVECDTPPPVVKKEEKTEEKPAKKGKK